MKTLIIYECIPYETYVGIIDLSMEDYEVLSVAHGHTVNADYDGADEATIQSRDEAADAISNGFATNPDNLKYTKTDIAQRLFMSFSNINGTDEARDLSQVEKMIHCAWIC